MLIVIFWVLVAIAASATVIGTRFITSEKKPPKRQRNITIIAIAFLWIVLIWSGTQLVIAAKHGCDDWNKTFPEIVANNKVTPYANALPDNLTGTIVVLFRYDCPDCHAIYPELQKFLENDDVYAISSRTEEGMALCELYQIEDIPTAIYFAPDETGAHDTKKSLYTIDSEGNAVFDNDSAQRLLKLQSEGK